MRNSIDLHTHTTSSDGSLTPSELVRVAAGSGIRLLSITDHDTVGGIAEALTTVEKLAHEKDSVEFSDPDSKLPFTLIPGVEISADYRHELHILGYFSQDTYNNIFEFLEIMRNARDVRNLKIIVKLRALGIKIDVSDVQKIAGKKVFGRPHIAAFLTNMGYSSSIKAAFCEYLSRGRKAYVQKEVPSPEHCVREIAEAGGVPVVAHPTLIGVSLRELRELTTSLIPHGLAGLEAFYPEYSPAETRNIKNLAESLGLLCTGGSDFHGAFRKNNKLGSGKNDNLLIPDFVRTCLLEKLRII